MHRQVHPSVSIARKTPNPLWARLTAPLRRRAFWFGVALTFSPMVFFADVLLSGQTWGGDATSLRWPVSTFIAESWKRGVVPLWNPYLFGGMPFLAHPESNVFYPFQALFVLFSPHLASQLYIVSAICLSTLFTFLLARRIGLSVWGSALAAILFSFNFSRLAKGSHVQLQHTLTWLPLQLWLVEGLFQSQAWHRHAALLAVAVAIQGLGMHAQMFLYCLTALAGYALWVAIRHHGLRPAALMRGLLPLAIGLLLISVVVVPGVELTGESTRGALAFEGFVEYAVDPRELSQLIHPMVFKTLFPGMGTIETEVYFGFLPWSFCLGWVFVRPKKTLVFFGFFAVTFLLAMQSPLLRLLFHLPGYNLFRALGRWTTVSALGLALVAGEGFDRLPGLSRRQLLAPFVLMAGWSLVLLAFSRRASAGSLDVVMLLVTLAIPTLWAISQDAAADFPRFLALLILLVDLWIVSQYGRYEGRSLDVTQARQRRFAEQITSSSAEGRVWRQPYRTSDVSNDNLYGPWPAITSHSALFLERARDLLGMDGSYGFEADYWVRETNVVPDLFHTRFIEVPSSVWGFLSHEECRNFSADVCFADPYPLELTPAEGMRLHLDWENGVDGLAIWSWAVNARMKEQGEPIGEVEILTQSGDTVALPVNLGEHTAEGAYHCSRPRPAVRHAQPETVTVWSDGECQWFSYVGRISLPRPIEVRRLTLRVVAGEARWVVQGVSFMGVDGSWHPLDPWGLKAGRDFVGFEPVEGPDPERIVLERPTQLPYAWGVEGLEVMPSSELVARLRGEGKALDVARLAYLEPEDEQAARREGILGADFEEGLVVGEVTSDLNRVRLMVEAQGEGFLVVSEVYFPGWEASVDGLPTRLWRVDYLLRGLLIPAGEHTVEMRYHPRSLRLGALGSGIGLLMLLVLSLRGVGHRPWGDGGGRAC